MTIEHERGGVIYRRTSIDLPSDIKAGVDEFGINVTATAVTALRKAIEEKKGEGS